MRHTPSWRATSTTAYLVVCPKMWTRAPRVIRLFGSALVWKGEILSKREPLAVNNAAVWIYIIQIDWLLMNFTYFAFFLARPSFGNSGVEFYRGHWGSKTIDRIHVLCVCTLPPIFAYITTITSNVNYDKLTTHPIMKFVHTLYDVRVCAMYTISESVKDVNISLFFLFSLALGVYATHYVRLVHYIRA